MEATNKKKLEGGLPVSPKMEVPARLEGEKRVLGSSLMEKVLTSKILVVGAGGIGCELLKNLVLSGYSNISVKQHVGKSKALVAREAALKYNPSAHIESFHANVKDSDFGPEFIRKFDLVLNALDNLSARRHVNRLCLATNTPLIESGTAGYLGQVQVIQKGVSECFECNPHPPPKTFPICTIRNNPSTPIHCIVWAKYMFERFFGPESDQEDDSRANLDDEEGKELTDEEKAHIQQLKEMMENDEIQLAEEKERSFGRWLFHKLFYSDVLYISTLKHLWRTSSAPEPLHLSKSEDTIHAEMSGISKFYNELKESSNLISDQRVWSPSENGVKFIKTAIELSKVTNKEKWEKDNPLHLDFVTAAANLRACVFHIDLTSKFSVKEQAGNIIPAIATTNAVVAGLIVMKAFKILDGKLPTCRHTYLKQKPHGRGQLFLGVSLDPPNPKCYVCGGHFIKLKINLTTTLFKQLVDDIICKTLNFVQPTIVIGDNIIYDAAMEDDDPGYQANQLKLTKNLTEIGVKHDTILFVTDEISDLKVEVSVVHCDAFEGEAFYEIEGVTETQKAEPPKVTNGEKKATETTAVVADDEIVMMVEKENFDEQRGQKRPLEKGNENEENPNKKVRRA